MEQFLDVTEEEIAQLNLHMHYYTSTFEPPLPPPNLAMNIGNYNWQAANSWQMQQVGLSDAYGPSLNSPPVGAAALTYTAARSMGYNAMLLQAGPSTPGLYEPQWQQPAGRLQLHHTFNAELMNRAPSNVPGGPFDPRFFPRHNPASQHPYGPGWAPQLEGSSLSDMGLGDAALPADEQSDAAEAQYVGDLDAQFGRYVQSNNTSITPEQSQGGELPETTSSSPASATSGAASSGTGATEGHGLGHPYRKVPFGDSERGRACAERDISKASGGPYTCFVCDEHEPGPHKQFTTWETFVSHVSRCAPLESMKPRCHFCGRAFAAYGRPDQMERHLVGEGGYLGCKALRRLIADGIKTNGKMGEWLREHGKPIHQKFLGARLAKDFYCAVHDNYAVHKLVDLKSRKASEKKTVPKAQKVQTKGRKSRKPKKAAEKMTSGTPNAVRTRASGRLAKKRVQ